MCLQYNVPVDLLRRAFPLRYKTLEPPGDNVTIITGSAAACATSGSSGSGSAAACATIQPEADGSAAACATEAPSDADDEMSVQGAPPPRKKVTFADTPPPTPVLTPRGTVAKRRSAVNAIDMGSAAACATQATSNVSLEGVPTARERERATEFARLEESKILKSNKQAPYVSEVITAEK